MKAISNFYTLFWIIYFPTCLAFQNYDWSDELLCIILMGFGVLEWRKRRRNKKMEKEMKQYWIIIGFYTVYSLIIQVTTFRGIYLDFLQQIRPYMVFYMTLFLNPQFSDKQKKWIVGSMLGTMVLYISSSGAIQKYQGGAEDGDLPMVALTTGMTYFLFMKRNQRNTYIAIVIMLIGLMSGKSKYMGQCVCFIGIVIFLKNKLKYKDPKIYVAFAMLITVVVFLTWTKFNGYYVEGMSDDAHDMARPATYKTAFNHILWDYFPFGSGLGSFGTAAAAKEYSPLYYTYHLDHIWGLSPDGPMFLADCFYPTLAEFGVVGIFLFCVFWRRRLLEIQKIDDMNHYKMALMAILALAIDSTANTAYLSGAGMGLFMTLAICLNSKEEVIDEDETDSDNENETLSYEDENENKNMRLRSDYWEYHKKSDKV